MKGRSDRAGRGREEAMRNVLAALAAVLIAAVTVGWARDWYRLERLTAGDGKAAFRVELDCAKVGADFSQACRAVRNLVKAEPKQTN
jgi:hypothetical protein